MSEPERLDAFMERANAAYYATCDPFADFTTAPEIAQMFGELIGAWAAICWQQMGEPSPVLLAEAGPGRGTLMADARRVIARVAPRFAQATRLHFIETSPRLRAIQAGTHLDATWHETLATLPKLPLILVANEFLDALPIRQFVRQESGWTERHVVAGVFVERASPGPGRPAAPGQIVETGQAASAWTTALARRIATDGGCALILDYGPADSAPGDSLQALHHGQPADPLAHPGQADLTAHVDFAAIAQAARFAGAAVHGPRAQGSLLERLGLFARTTRLAAGLPAAEALALMDAAQRLAQPERMGKLFKALAICHPLLPTPPGFEP